MNAPAATTNAAHVEPRCPACGERADSAARETCGEYRIHSCAACGSDFCDPMRAAPPAWYEEREVYFHRWEFEEFLRDAPWPRGRLLEIGCGAGIFLQLVRDAGYAAVGLDFNRLAVEAATRHGLHVLRMTLEEFLAERHEPFDVAAFFHTLEHLSDPDGFLRMVRGALRGDGFLALSVPNRNRWTLALAPREHWDFPPHHLMRFTKEGLQRLLERNAFRVVRMADEPPKLFRTLHAEMTTAAMNSIRIGASRAFLPAGEGGSAAPTDLRANGEDSGSPIFHALVRAKRAVFSAGAAPFSFWKFLSLRARARGRTGQSLYALAQKCSVEKP
jgi:SAM-dependent methyltransferase